MTVLAAVDEGDGSTSVVQRGHELATAFDEELVVLHVEPETESLDAAESVAADAIRAALDDREGVTAVGALGDSSTRILREADERDVRYVVLGPRKRTPVGKALMGSVAQLVVLNADRPVVLTD
ncbi:universal stress protein [Haloplanus sp. GCM10025708]|uniref:universal stress protein n=1 Tax=Haloferacaceae TaxID=1644056 RepID=UPI003618FD10